VKKNKFHHFRSL